MDQFLAFEWIRKNKKHKNKSIGFLFKFAKINRCKNIQIYGSSISLMQFPFQHGGIHTFTSQTIPLKHRLGIQKNLQLTERMQERLNTPTSQ